MGTRVAHLTRGRSYIYIYNIHTVGLPSLGHRRTTARGVVACIDIISYTYIILYVTVYYYYYYYYYCCCFARGDSAGGEQERESASERKSRALAAITSLRGSSASCCRSGKMGRKAFRKSIKIAAGRAPPKSLGCAMMCDTASCPGVGRDRPPANPPTAIHDRDEVLSVLLSSTRTVFGDQTSRSARGS